MTVSIYSYLAKKRICFSPNILSTELNRNGSLCSGRKSLYYVYYIDLKKIHHFWFISLLKHTL